MEISATKRKRDQISIDDTILQKRKKDDVDFEIEETIKSIDNEKSDRYFDIVPDDVMRLIVSRLPIRQWPILERVDRRFQRGVAASWRGLRRADLEEMIDEKIFESKNAYERRAILFSILQRLADRSPIIDSLSGFSAIVKSMDLRCFRLMIQFTNLERLDFSHCHLPVGYLADFLSRSGSRARLRDLRFDESLTFANATDLAAARQRNDQLLSDALTEIPNRPALKLKTLVYDNNNCFDGSFLANLDVSELELLKIANSQLGTTHLANFLGRCTRLTALDLDLSKCFVTENGRRISLLSSTPVSNALRSLPSENLTTLKIVGYHWKETDSANRRDTSLSPVLINLGRRCRIENLWIADHGEAPDVADAIADNFSFLKSLHLDIAHFNKASLTRLVTNLSGLKILVFYSSKPRFWRVDDDVIRLITIHQRELIKLDLHAALIANPFGADWTKMEKLKKLRVGGSGVSNKWVISCCQSIGQQLEALELPSSAHASDMGVAFAVKYLSNVRRLDLSGAGVTDVSLRTIANSCPRLRELNLAQCRRVTKSGVQAIVDACRELVRLKLDEGQIRSGVLMSKYQKILFID